MASPITPAEQTEPQAVPAATRSSDLSSGHLLKLERLELPTSDAKNRQTRETDAATQSAHTFLRPVKRIHDGADVSQFLVSKAYRDIGLFIMQLNHSLCPRTTTLTASTASAASTASTAPTTSTAPLSASTGMSLPTLVSASKTTKTTVFTLDGPRQDPPSVLRLQKMLERLSTMVDEVPPDPGPRRFGNVSFRKWHQRLADEADTLLRTCVQGIWGAGVTQESGESGGDDSVPATAMDEVSAYFLGAFGSSQRLDYGTGHELSFLAFLGSLWKLGVFADGDGGDDGEAVERSIVLGVMEPYFHVIRKLILTYTLEPAGSHGVWGLDDHSFLPYVFGSAQLTRPISATATSPMPQEGSAPRAPKTADILKPATVAVQQQRNLYFSAIGFINDVKTGPFWEHSPVLYDISGIRDGWGKVNKGMIKMYNAEVLSKFPVVQHFPFGSLFSWDLDPDHAHDTAPPTSIHLSNQPMAAAATAAALAKHAPTQGLFAGQPPPPPPPPLPATAAPWAQATRMPPGSTGPGIPYSRVPPTAAAPPAFCPLPASSAASSAGGSGSASAQVGLTRAPWAK